MALEELSQKYFSRERVRNRILKRAAEIWGYSESEIDDFDPLVTLLIEASSVEFEKIAGEIAKTQNRMLERIAQLLYPGSVTVNPAYGILQARSAEPVSVISTDMQFILRPSQNDRKRETANVELFFSPSRPSKIIDGSITYIASAREIYQLEDETKKFSIASSSEKNTECQYSIWLGLEMHEDIDSLQGIPFFFNWINQPDSEEWFHYLQYTEWFLSSGPLPIKPGFDYEDEKDYDPSNSLEREFDMMYSIEKQVNDLFGDHFITIGSHPSVDITKTRRELYPRQFDILFSKSDLKSFEQELLWIEIKFPTSIPLEALDNIWCSVNSFPVLNRKLNSFSYKLLNNLNIVPLETEGFFLSIKEISNSYGHPTKLIPFANSVNLSAETYTLRYGVNRFDERDARDTLAGLVELLKEESSYFSSLGEEFLIQNIRELNQILARLEDRVKGRNKHQSPYPFLIIRPLKEGVNVKIEFWSCNGELANKIPVGTHLQPYRNSAVKDASIVLLTSTSGARDKFDDAEKIDHYKTSLLTRNRIVTIEDLQTFVYLELGKLAKNIQFKKTFMAGTKPGEGFIRCLEIKITPKDNTLTGAEWQQRLKTLELKLKKQSVNNIPYCIILDK